MVNRLPSLREAEAMNTWSTPREETVTRQRAYDEPKGIRSRRSDVLKEREVRPKKIASTKLVLPAPLGPMITVKPRSGSKLTPVRDRTRSASTRAIST